MTKAPPARPAVDRLPHLSTAESAQVLALAAAVHAADGVYPLAEHVVLAVRNGAVSPAVHLLARDDGGELVGYAYVDWSRPDGDASVELTVHPRHRRRGVARALLDQVLAAAGASAVSIWAHGDHAVAREFAASTGFTRARVLFRMNRSLLDPLPNVAVPDGVRLRAFRPGRDEAAWLAVNARAFADHPEQGRWTDADLRARMAEPWFDPAGFLLAVDDRDRLLGFHWTKVHGPDLGEVYVLGVDPAGHRRGLGAALTVAGLRHLSERGPTEAMLYVDESNLAAVALYERLGFAVRSVDVAYRRVP